MPKRKTTKMARIRDRKGNVHYGQHKDCMWCDMARILVGKKPTSKALKGVT